MKCSYCGQENEDGSRFCVYCGRNFESIEQPVQKPNHAQNDRPRQKGRTDQDSKYDPTSKKNRRIGMLICALVAVVSLALIILILSGKLGA